ncbi:hypothetical protein Tco_1532372 [Tanacetum coccineum]
MSESKCWSDTALGLVFKDFIHLSHHSLDGVCVFLKRGHPGLDVKIWPKQLALHLVLELEPEEYSQKTEDQLYLWRTYDDIKAFVKITDGIAAFVKRTHGGFYELVSLISMSNVFIIVLINRCFEVNIINCGLFMLFSVILSDPECHHMRSQCLKLQWMEHGMIEACLPEVEEIDGPEVGYPAPLHAKACLCFQSGTGTMLEETEWDCSEPSVGLGGVTLVLVGGILDLGLLLFAETRRGGGVE